MEIKIFEDAAALGLAAAEIFANQIKAKPDCILGLATGASPVPTYTRLIELYKAGEISFKDVSTFNLDEYCDLPKNDKNSYYTFMHENLFDHVDIKEENVHILNGNAEDTAREAADFDKAMAEAGGVDIQLLGIGNNGHIGFNEPADAFTTGTFKVQLTESTLQANSRYFDENPMPHYALTMGVGSIMSAKKIVLIATGAAKAQVIYDTVKGSVTPQVPASILQNHADCILLFDKAAASKL